MPVPQISFWPVVVLHITDRLGETRHFCARQPLSIGLGVGTCLHLYDFRNPSAPTARAMIREVVVEPTYRDDTWLHGTVYYCELTALQLTAWDVKTMAAAQRQLTPLGFIHQTKSLEEHYDDMQNALIALGTNITTGQPPRRAEP